MKVEKLIVVMEVGEDGALRQSRDNIKTYKTWGSAQKNVHKLATNIRITEVENDSVVVRFSIRESSFTTRTTEHVAILVE